MTYKNKYLKYKLKYLNLKKKLRGGMDLEDPKMKKAIKTLQEREEAPLPSGPPSPGCEYVSFKLKDEQELDPFKEVYIPDTELMKMHKEAENLDPVPIEMHEEADIHDPVPIEMHEEAAQREKEADLREMIGIPSDLGDVSFEELLSIENDTPPTKARGRSPSKSRSKGTRGRSPNKSRSNSRSSSKGRSRSRSKGRSRSRRQPKPNRRYENYSL